MKDFAKLFRHPTIGQVLVMRQSGDDGPELRVFVHPPGLDVCSIALGFSDDDAGYEKADAAMECVDESRAYKMAESVMEQISDLVGDNDQARRESA